jgi:DNA adenine methylase
VLRRFYPARFNRYFEPFLGSGAMFYDLSARGALTDREAFLSDANGDLIGCYRRVADSLDALVAELERLAAAHAAGGRAHYLAVRDDLFNPLRARWRASGGRVDDYPIELAAMLIYLNRTGYNGLFRLNASGEYNVPPGRYTNPKIVNRPLLAAASQLLAAPAVTIRLGGFEDVLRDARENDFVYFDPPYAPLSATANFRGYTGQLFSDADQQRLQQTLIALAERQVGVLLSNSIAPSVTTLYERNPAAQAAGLRTFRFPARRAVNSNAHGRGTVEELVVSNIPIARQAR